MREAQRKGNRYLAGLVMAFALAFLAAGSLGPARHSPYFVLIVPLPALSAFALGRRAWSAHDGSSPAYSAAGLVLLLGVLIFSHLLPRSTG